ncbi:unnamed protein product [Toxocara canis]|uniref:Rx_N domain-containing protein n=1 Tax=Toxocara canis TaxID=6265 RepID=A0A183UWR4_TOXCA|nr:unnamed protein product [Toxocara canis]
MAIDTVPAMTDVYDKLMRRVASLLQDSGDDLGVSDDSVGMLKKWNEMMDDFLSDHRELLRTVKKWHSTITDGNVDDEILRGKELRGKQRDRWRTSTPE